MSIFLSFSKKKTLTHTHFIIIIIIIIFRNSRQVLTFELGSYARTQS